MKSSTLEPNPATASNRQVPLRIDDSKMAVTYANAIRTASTADEVVLDFGISLPTMNQTGAPTQVFAIDNRVIVNWANAKRLALTLSNMVQAFEQQQGEISLAVSAPPGRKQA